MIAGVRLYTHCQLKQLAAEITARQLDRVVARDEAGDLDSAAHVAGLAPADVHHRRKLLSARRDKCRKEAGPIADCATRELNARWGIHVDREESPADDVDDDADDDE